VEQNSCVSTVPTHIDSYIFKKISDHPNCKLFITHGGLHSALESINASVPLVGIPIYSDQYSNMAAIENYGVGKVLPLEEVSARLSADVKEVLHNPMYVFGRLYLAYDSHC